MAKLTPLCHATRPEADFSEGMCDACKTSYAKAVEFDSGTAYLLNWAAAVARESEYRRAHRFERKRQRLSVAATRRKLIEQETQLSRREERDKNFENWRDDPRWSLEFGKKRNPDG